MVPVQVQPAILQAEASLARDRLARYSELPASGDQPIVPVDILRIRTLDCVEDLQVDDG